MTTNVEVLSIVLLLMSKTKMLCMSVPVNRKTNFSQSIGWEKDTNFGRSMEWESVVAICM